MEKQRYLVARMPYDILVDPKIFVENVNGAAIRHKECALRYNANPGERLAVWCLGEAKGRTYVVGADKGTIYETGRID